MSRPAVAIPVATAVATTSHSHAESEEDASGADAGHLPATQPYSRATSSNDGHGLPRRAFTALCAAHAHRATASRERRAGARHEGSV